MEDFGAKFRLGTALGLERGAIEAERGGALPRPHLKKRILMIEQCRPAENLAGSERLYAHDIAGRAQFDCDASGHHQVKGSGALPVPEDHFVLFERDFTGEGREAGNLRLRETGHKRVIAENLMLFECHLPHHAGETPQRALPKC